MLLLVQARMHACIPLLICTHAARCPPAPGFMHGTASTEWDVRGHAALVVLTLGILAAASSLSVFGRDRLVWWREQAAGVRAPSYFVAHTATNLIEVAVAPLLFLSIYHRRARRLLLRPAAVCAHTQGPACAYSRSPPFCTPLHAA